MIIHELVRLGKYDTYQKKIVYHTMTLTLEKMFRTCN